VLYGKLHNLLPDLYKDIKWQNQRYPSNAQVARGVIGQPRRTQQFKKPFFLDCPRVSQVHYFCSLTAAEQLLMVLFLSRVSY